MANAELPRNLILLFMQAREVVFAAFRPILNDAGLTEQQWRVIRALYELEPLEPNQICDVCLILSPSLAGILARMEDLGLIRKSRVENDQRRVLIHLTAKSRKLVEKLIPLIVEQYGLIERAMGPKLFADMYSLLDKVVALEDAGIARVALPAKRGTKKTVKET
jgi:homoprotocatechuate degradation regulator HpaR